MHELLQRARPDGGSGPFETIAAAAKLVDEGKQAEAKSLLRTFLETPELETRIQLRGWTALRELNEQPDARQSGEILGVVIEVPMKGAYDTLAAYQDGSARYLNYSGAGIFWDAPDATIKGMCHALINSTIPATSRVKPRTSVSLPKSGIQVTILTRSGMHLISNPTQGIVRAAQQLMLELIRRSKEQKDQR